MVFARLCPPCQKSSGLGDPVLKGRNVMTKNVVVFLFHLEISSFFLSTKTNNNRFYQTLLVKSLRGGKRDAERGDLHGGEGGIHGWWGFVFFLF
jgi:hypothetical protein